MRRPQLRRAGESVWTVIVTLAGVTALLTAVVALLARIYDGDSQPLIIVAALAHQMLWTAPIAIVLFAVSRRWYGVVVAAIVVALAAATQLPTYVGADTPGSGQALTVLQANLRVGSAQPEDLVRTVSIRHVDILTTVELTPAERDRLVSAWGVPTILDSDS